ncbi:uncharacterized protein F5Z01DRAFT_232268 [Emericellopsis atlantica]|uniref:Uncharacterized protein n=1 Tax=Emericellopsis atlantica TaxID=2614577 RepID=A0A9P7ZIF4_9HYPO|nr:uncharacterized protein F5Z01DRAFT_232268 [Emericellopsis atlantica]KAG9252506.1 hypothetical protein F5Z01DRAFT_232268 [Emericellopsis atlantica]
MMSFLINNLIQPLNSLVFGEATAAPSPRPGTRDENGLYEPTPTDIFVVRAMLVKAMRLPPDIVDAVFDYAEYWAHSSNYIDYIEEHKNPLRILGGSASENRFLLRSFPVGFTSLGDRQSLADTLTYDMNEATPRPLSREHDPQFFESLLNHPTPKLARPVRKVVFTVKMKDQGWVGGRQHQKGAFNGSWTWVEAGLERFDSEQECDENCVADARYNSASSTAHALPLCALRSIYPEAKSAREEGKFNYQHELAADQEREIQRSRLATREWLSKTITWRWTDSIDPESEDGEELFQEGRGRGSATGEFVRNLKLGDVITIWGKARFRGWVLNLEKVKVDVYWAV